jgi:hypothetical protein
LPEGGVTPHQRRQEAITWQLLILVMASSELDLVKGVVNLGWLTARQALSTTSLLYEAERKVFSA